MIHSHPKSNDKKIVIIIGAGFGGLFAAKSLANHKNLHVIIIDKKNHHLFQPLLYQVATGGLNPADIASPIRAEFSEVENVETHLGSVSFVSLKEKYVTLKEKKESIRFDYLICACGASHSYFGKPEWEQFAPGLKTLEQATEIRRRILTAFEDAENELDPIIKKNRLNFVVIGAGPTGVELAGAIAEISRDVISKDFHHINPSEAKIILIEAGPRVLAAFDPMLSETSKQDLEQIGVTVKTNSKVINISAEEVTLENEIIKTKNVFWAAGVLARNLDLDVTVNKDRSGRIIVEKDLSIPQHPFAFVIGDMAAIEMPDKKYVPGLAPAAIQGGKLVAQNICADLKNETRIEFKYLDKGIMATIGKGKAILQFKSIKIDGRLAWLSWLFVHLLYLIGFKNRITVFATWSWSYLFSRRGTRLITDRNWVSFSE